MPTLTPDEARRRFGELIHRPSQTYREFVDDVDGGIWRPVYADGELVSYRLYQIRKLKKRFWPKKRT